jgi:hypothetical protein
MSLFDRRTANVLLTILLFAVVLAIVYIARGVIVIFVFAILFAYLIDPIVRFLQRPDDVTITATSEGVRGYALDPKSAEALWKKSEEMVGEKF